MSMNIIGKRILNLLEEHHMSQRDLAIKTNITEVSLSRYINGTRIPKVTVLSAVARNLNTSVDYLLGNDYHNYSYSTICNLIKDNVSKMSFSDKMKLVDILFREDDK